MGLWVQVLRLTYMIIQKRKLIRWPRSMAANYVTGIRTHSPG